MMLRRSRPSKMGQPAEFDPETVSYFYRARYYDQNVGRFVSEDPAHVTGGINFYVYVRNEPTRFVDPAGLQAEDIVNGCALCHWACNLKFKMDAGVIGFAAWTRGWAGGSNFSRGGNNPVKVGNDSTNAVKDCGKARDWCHFSCNVNHCGFDHPPFQLPFAGTWPFSR